MKKNIQFLFILLIIVSFHVPFAQAQVAQSREHDPVIISGSDLTSFSSITPNQIVGFKFSSDIWIQIPIQIDEREVLDIVTPYGAQAGIYNNTYAPSVSNPTVLYYSDSSTDTGADSNTFFDDDDELVFMASDTGDQAIYTFPSDTVENSCQEIAIIDSLNSYTNYVYICENAAALQSDAGVDYVNYTSNVTGTAGFPHNDNLNVEDTTISTSEYSWHFASEWVSDEFKIAGGTLDILDRHKIMAYQGGAITCNLTDHAFSSNENAYVTVKDGPIRVIRSYLGANSGVNTHRTHFFYKSRHDMTNNLRVHPFVAEIILFDAYDYNSAANGMTYLNDQQASTSDRVIIDGVDDVLVQNAEALVWEEIRGATDVVSIIHSTNTDALVADVSFLTYYEDDSVSPEFDCGNTGDGEAWSTSGIGTRIKIGICTDILHGNCDAPELRTIGNTRIAYLDQGVGIDDDITAQYATKIDNPLNISTSLFKIKNKKKSGSKRVSQSRLDEIFGNKSSQAEVIEINQEVDEEIQCVINYTRLVKRGTQGDDVREVQICMNSLGYITGPEDGIYGPLTYAGITNYQKAQNLHYIDGIVGPETSGALNTR